MAKRDSVDEELEDILITRSPAYRISSVNIRVSILRARNGALGAFGTS